MNNLFNFFTDNIINFKEKNKYLRERNSYICSKYDQCDKCKYIFKRVIHMVEFIPLDNTSYEYKHICKKCLKINI
jgi:hypothetical protein